MMTMFGFGEGEAPQSGYHGRVSATVTVWFVSTDNPAAVLKKEPKADRGFGRKYLAQLNPRWPVTLIGQFPLNRSARASQGEFYVAGFPGIRVIHTLIDDAGKLSNLDPRLLESFEGRDIFAFAYGTDGRWADFSGFAHWHDGTLLRSLCATREELHEDIGLPEPFESPFWAGERAQQVGGISLPFIPADLSHAAEREWLGVPITPDGPDVQVVAYAVDGRPAPRVDESDTLRPASTQEIVAHASSRLGLGINADYDDYEQNRDSAEGDEFTRLAEAALAAAKRVIRGTSRRMRNTGHAIQEKLRHIDRD